MNLTRLPVPPNPDSYGNPSAWSKAAYEWMVITKSIIETDSTVNTAPIAPFQIGSYTAVNTLTGTDSTSNFVATLVTSMQQSGLVSPKTVRKT